MICTGPPFDLLIDSDHLLPTARQHGKRSLLLTAVSRDAVAHLFPCNALVHGSLARAGKVKSQTPKVEKQEKKKVPKGRAKKRMLYNRRCVLNILLETTKC